MAPEGPLEAAAPGQSGPTGPFRRLHPSSLLFDVGRRFASILGWAVAALVFAARSEDGWYLLFLLLPLGEAVIRFVSFRYALGAGELVVRDGLFVRSVRHVPYTRIHNLDTVQGPLHRLLGVVEVRVETAGGSEPEAVFRVITSGQLAELNARVFAAPKASVAAEPEDAAAERGDVGSGDVVFRMRAGDVLLFGLLAQRGLVVVGGAFVAMRELAERAGRERFDVELERASEGVRALGRPAWILLAVAAFVVIELGSVAWAFLTLHGFRIERRGDDLRTTCGLLTRHTATLARGRIQLLEMRQGWLQRLLGRAAVRAVSAGGGAGKESPVARKWLVPLCRVRELGAVLAGVQPGARFEDVHWRPVHPRAERRLRVRALLVLAAPAAVAWLYSLAAGIVATLVAVVLACAFARLRARVLAWALGEDAVYLRDGLLGRRHACVRFEKIQSVHLRRSPFDRRARMASLALDTAGAPGSLGPFRVRYLGVRDALRLLRRLRDEAAAVSFHW